MARAGFQSDLSKGKFAVLKEPKIHIKVTSGSFKAGYGKGNSSYCKLLKCFG